MNQNPRTMIVSPSILAADFSSLGAEISKLNNSGAAYLHIDVMDGMFVPNISLGIPVVASIRKTTNMFFDVHLMIENPLRYLEQFHRAGADLLTIHVEAEPEVRKALLSIRKMGIKAGISIKPGTGAEAIYPYLDLVDMVLVMTVEPGFGGQSFMEDVLPKIMQIRRKFITEGLDIDIQVDGGISPSTVQKAAACGANVFVAGSSVFQSPKPAETVKELLDIASRSFDSRIHVS